MLCGDCPAPLCGPMPAPFPADPSQADITLDCDITLDPDGGTNPAEISLNDAEDDDDDVGEDDMFVIDRKGTSTPRAVPAPVLSLSPSLALPAAALSFPSITEKSPAPSEKVGASPAVTPAKKFKRRNQAIYGAEADG